MLDPDPRLFAPPSLSRRLCCVAYELLLLAGVSFISAYLFSTLAQQRDPLHLRHALFGFVACVCGAYFIVSWCRGGQTLPMKTWHIRILTRAGQPLRPLQAALRYLAAWLWWLPPLAFGSLAGLPLRWTLGTLAAWVVVWACASLLDPWRRLPHDLLAGTRFVVTGKPPA